MEQLSLYFCPFENKLIKICTREATTRQPPRKEMVSQALVTDHSFLLILPDLFSSFAFSWCPFSLLVAWDSTCFEFRLYAAARRLLLCLQTWSRGCGGDTRRWVVTQARQGHRSTSTQKQGWHLLRCAMRSVTVEVSNKITSSMFLALVPWGWPDTLVAPLLMEVTNITIVLGIHR